MGFRKHSPGGRADKHSVSSPAQALEWSLECGPDDEKANVAAIPFASYASGVCVWGRGGGGAFIPILTKDGLRCRV